MFIGHFALGFAAKKPAPRVSLALLMTAVAWADILWTIFLLLGVEHARISPGDTKYTPLNLYDYPWSHSLLMLVIWGALLGGIYWLIGKDAAGAWAVGACVVSHWVLDWVTHRPGQTSDWDCKIRCRERWWSRSRCMQPVCVSIRRQHGRRTG